MQLLQEEADVHGEVRKQRRICTFCVFWDLMWKKQHAALLCFLTVAEPPVWRCVGVCGVCRGLGGGVTVYGVMVCLWLGKVSICTRVAVCGFFSESVKQRCLLFRGLSHYEYHLPV